MTKHEQPSSYQTMTKNKKPNSNEKKQTTEDKVTSDHLKDAAKPADASSPTHAIEEQLQQTVRDLEQKVAEQSKEMHDLKLRNLAEIKNIQERYSREAANARTYAHQYFAKDILDIVDALDQAEQSLDGKQKEGIQLITEMLQKAFQKHHIETIDPTGENYDHHFHEAMAMQPSETVADNHVIQVVQKGYRIKDRLLRAARVIVAKNPK